MLHLESIEVLCSTEQTFLFRDQVLSNSAGLGAMIAALLLKGGRKLDQAASDAATEDYLDALEDLPAWSVREALRKWNRGESATLEGKKHDFNWRPEPPTLRRLSLRELAPIKVRIDQLSKLLLAVPRQEFDEEHCADMRDRLKGLAAGIQLRSLAAQAAE